MGKAKQPKKDNPESLKEAGNRAFANHKFEEALQCYSDAIKLQENHIYFANRKFGQIGTAYL